MNKKRIALIVVEAGLLVMTIFLITRIYEQKTPEKRIAVIVPNSGDEGWDFILKGMKEAANANDIHLIICNTSDIESAQTQAELIREQRDNNVSGFIIYPAPGEDTEKMLEEECSGLPYLLIVQDVYASDQENVVVQPDNYKMGYLLGEQMKLDDANGLEGKSIGIVAGFEKNAQTQECEAGFLDAVGESGCSISWTYEKQKEKSFLDEWDSFSKVDYLAVLDWDLLDDISEEAEEKETALYGIGNSMKDISLLDKGKIEAISVTDYYALGYGSVGEIAKKLENSFYTMKNYEVSTRIIGKDELTLQDIERFIYSYE